MNKNIIDKIEQAREFFDVKEYPSNFFDSITSNKNYIDQHGIFLFKEDIDKLSGFIGYAKDGRPAICINYIRPIGHQNFTLAHEVGHYFLHKGENFSDERTSIEGNPTQLFEKEANEFAHEFLYPTRFFMEDYKRIEEQGLLRDERYLDLAVEIDKICHKHCISFNLVLRKVLFKAYRIGEIKKFNKEIKNVTGGISDYFDKDFYTVNENNPMYQKYMEPYRQLKININELEIQRKISAATAESILYRYDLLEE